jgi:tetratricopeptide (TPR) repeat protein
VNNSSAKFKLDKCVPHLLLAFLLLTFAPQSGHTLDSVGEAYMEQASRASARGDYKSAKKLLKMASKLTDNPYQDKLYLSRLFNDLGECYRKLMDDKSYVADPDDPDEQSQSTPELAETYLRKSLEIKEGLLGTNSIVLATGLENLAELYSTDNKYDEAEALYRKAIKIRDYKAGPKSYDSASDYYRLGEICNHSKRYPEAIESYEQAMSVWLKGSKANDPIIGKCHEKLAVVYRKTGPLSKEITHYDRAMAIYDQNLPGARLYINNMKKQLPDLPEEAYATAYSDWQNHRSIGSHNRKMIPYYENMITAARRFGQTEDVKFFQSLISEITSTSSR